MLKHQDWDLFLPLSYGAGEPWMQGILDSKYWTLSFPPEARERAQSRDSWNTQLEGSSKYHAWTRIDTTGNLEEWKRFSYLVIAFNQL